MRTSERHLRRVLTAYLAHYSRARPLTSRTPGPDRVRPHPWSHRTPYHRPARSPERPDPRSCTLHAADELGRDGIGGAVLEAFNDARHPARIAHLAVRGLPGSGTSAELMDAAGISASHIARAAREILGG
jgi:hypothetical protein